MFYRPDSPAIPIVAGKATEWQKFGLAIASMWGCELHDAAADEKLGSVQQQEFMF